MRTKLEDLVDQALENKLKQENATDSSDLLGDCYYNVIELEKVFKENDVSYTVYRGALKGDYRPDNIPDSFDEANKIGRVHYWIESNGFICEICSESELNYGKKLVSEERPPNYIVFSDSKANSLI